MGTHNKIRACYRKDISGVGGHTLSSQSVPTSIWSYMPFSFLVVEGQLTASAMCGPDRIDQAPDVSSE
eukprot:1434094-Rhodomonas_salina.3